jgi:hypothetical protein
VIQIHFSPQLQHRQNFHGKFYLTETKDEKKSTTTNKINKKQKKTNWKLTTAKFPHYSPGMNVECINT